MKPCFVALRNAIPVSEANWLAESIQQILSIQVLFAKLTMKVDNSCFEFITSFYYFLFLHEGTIRFWAWGFTL